MGEQLYTRGEELHHRASKKTSVSVPRLLWFYALWVALAGISAGLGHSFIESGSALFLLGGIASTNFFFLSVSRTEALTPAFSRLLALYQTIMGIAWASAYCYFSLGAGDIVLGIYMTLMLYSVSHLDTRTTVKLCSGVLASYVLVTTLKAFAQPSASYPLADSFRFLVLLAICGWVWMFSHRLRDLRNQLQDRNEELQGVVDKVTRIAEEDHLTKSYNRRYIMDVLSRERSTADRSGNTFAVLLFDLDHFKAINDRFGHLVGDQILSDFAARVKRELRGMDTVNSTDHQRAFGRYGGEEFLAVLPETDLLGAQRCADRIRQLIDEHAFRDNYHVTVSVGVAQYQLGETIPQLLGRTDKALYRAKKDGRNLVRCSERPQDKTSNTVPRLRVLK